MSYKCVYSLFLDPNRFCRHYLVMFEGDRMIHVEHSAPGHDYKRTAALILESYDKLRDNCPDAWTADNVDMDCEFENRGLPR